MKLYISTPACPETGLSSRYRNPFHSTEAERRFMRKLEVAKALRKHGTRYSAQFMARNHTLTELQKKLKKVTKLIRSI